MSTQIILETQGLYKSFDSKSILENISISVKKGEIYGILGANGAGKTTLLKLAAGLLEPTCGNVKVLGLNVEDNKSKVLNHMGTLIESPYFYEHLSARENLEIHLEYMGAQGDIGAALSKVGLENIDRPISKYSMGMRQRLAIARTFIHRPEILLLDEPINGLDPIGIKDMRELFQKLAQEGITILISSHILNEIEQTVHRALIISQGQMVEELVMADLVLREKENLENYIIKRMRGNSNA